MSAGINKKLHYYFEGEALTRLARDLDIDPKSGKTQQDVMREYAKKIVEELLPEIRCPDKKGAILNLDFPTDLLVFENQLSDLLKSLNDLSAEAAPMLEAQNWKVKWLYDEVQRLSNENPDSEEYSNTLLEFDNAVIEFKKKKEELNEIFGSYEDLIRRIRKDLVKLIKEELENRDLNKDIGIMGRFYGSGGMGTVHSCRIGNKDIAIKYRHDDLPMQEEGKSDVSQSLGYNSVELISATKESENLVGFFGSLETDNGSGNLRQIDFFEEITGAVDLHQHLRTATSSDPEKLKPSLTVFLESIFMPVLNGVKALHDKKLVHCDIKPENILVRPLSGLKTKELGRYSDVKLGDYDMVQYSGGSTEIPSGTPLYMSPEQWVGGEITCKSDIYSLGMMLYSLLGGELPKTTREISTIAVKGVDISNFNVPEDIKKIIEKCLKRNPDDRSDIDQLIAEINGYIEKKNEEDRLEAALQSTDTYENVEDTMKMAA